MPVRTTTVALILRISLALFTRTYFQPDEYFQSLEPAYALVFGYGHLTWEWVAPQPIRSIVYPALNVPIYWLLKASGLVDNPIVGDWLLIACPRVLHGALAAAMDVWICKLARRVLGERYVSTVLFLSITSTFHALSLSRSLSNSLETSLTTIAFSYYPWDNGPDIAPLLVFDRQNIRKVLIFAALSCAVRPTNVVIWICLFATLLWHLRYRGQMVKVILLDAMVIGLGAIVLVTFLDSLYYQRVVFTPANFLLTNLSGVSLFYGGNAWHFYLTSAFPILCTTCLPYVLLGLWSIRTASLRDVSSLRNMAHLLFWTISVYSLAGHKEWRFIHPLLPLLHIFAAKWLVDNAEIPQNNTKQDDPQANGETVYRYFPPIRKCHLMFIMATVPASVYLVLWYCSGPISVMSYIRSLPPSRLSDGLGFLMPCHSTPGHAYLHRPQLVGPRMWSLGCEPPLRGQDLTIYQDQTDIFYISPLAYMQQHFPPKVNPEFPISPYPSSPPGVSASASNFTWKHEWPRHLVFFGALLDYEGVGELLEERGYREVWRRGRSWEGDGKRQGGVRVWTIS